MSRRLMWTHLLLTPTIKLHPISAFYMYPSENEEATLTDICMCFIDRSRHFKLRTFLNRRHYCDF